MSLLSAALDVDLNREVEAVEAVDQRQTERRRLNHQATVTVVGPSGQVLEGEIRNISEGGTQIQLEEPLAPFTLVRIEYDDNLLLGEVVYCQAEQIGWLIGLRIEHGLFGLKALSAALESF
jgi:hypothetical protein